MQQIVSMAPVEDLVTLKPDHDSKEMSRDLRDLLFDEQYFMQERGRFPRKMKDL
jgi:hypothetical protein